MRCSLCLLFVVFATIRGNFFDKPVITFGDVSFGLARNKGNSSSATRSLYIDIPGYEINIRTKMKPIGLEMDLYRKGRVAGGRDDKLIARVIVPLILGFKLAALTLATLVAVAFIILKSILASKVALLLIGTVALKSYLKEKRNEEHIIDYYPLLLEGLDHGKGYKSPLNYSPHSERHSSETNIYPVYSDSEESKNYTRSSQMQMKERRNVPGRKIVPFIVRRTSTIKQ